MVKEIALDSSFHTKDEEKLLPKVLTADTMEDYATAVALTLRQRAGVSWLPMLLPRGSRLPDLQIELSSLHDYVGVDEYIPKAEWTPFQRLWLRWQAPLDFVAPMRWYLTAAWPSTETPTSLTASVDTCLQELAALPPQLRSQHIRTVLHLPQTIGIVVGWGEWQWALPAMLHAHLSAKPFIWCENEEELVEIVCSDISSITICVPVHQLHLDLLNKLTDACSFRLDIPRVKNVHFFSRPLSFFTARTLEILSRLPVKHHFYKQVPVERAAWVFTGEMPGKVIDPEVTYLSREEASVGHLELVDQPEVLMIWAHSREDLVHLGPDALCGMSADAPLGVSNGPFPACVYDGQCVKAGAVLPVNQLSTKALLMGGCNLMRLGGRSSFAPEYTIAFSSLEGACNLVVASRRTRFGYAFEQIFMYQLIRAGMSIGEAIRLVNNSLPFSGPESPDYLVLGEGDWSPFAPLENHVRMAITADGNGWHVECREVDAQYIEIRLPSFAAELYVRPVEVTPEVKDIFYSVVPEADGTCRVFLFSWHRMQANQLSLRIDPQTAGLDVQMALSVAYRNYVYDRLFRSYLPKFENWQKELHSLGIYIARHLNEANHQPIAYHEVEIKAVEAEMLLSRMDHAICSYLLDRIAANAFVWLDQYMEVDGCFSVAEHLPTDISCPYCGSPVVRRVIRHHFEPDIAREFALCQTCGNVWDVPLGGIQPVFKGKSVLLRATQQPYAVTIRNTVGRRVRGWLGFRIYQAQRHGVVVDPPVQELVLEPGAEVDVPFTIDIGAHTPAHMEFARGFWVSELNVAVFQCNILVVPDEDRRKRVLGAF